MTNRTYYSVLLVLLIGLVGLAMLDSLAHKLFDRPATWAIEMSRTVIVQHEVGFVLTLCGAIYGLLWLTALVVNARED